MTPPTTPATMPIERMVATARPRRPPLEEDELTVGGVYNHEGSLLMTLYLSQFFDVYGKKS
jgi:hypothetical protein